MNIPKSVIHTSAIIITVLLISQSMNFASFGSDMVSGSSDTHHWADEIVSSLISSSLIEVGEFLTSEYDLPITRGTFTVLFMRLLSGRVENSDSTNRSTNFTYESSMQVFSDIPIESEYYIATAQAKSRQIVMGFPDGTFLPEEQIQRQDVLTIIGRAIESGAITLADGESNDKGGITFSDVSAIDDYARAYIIDLASRSIIIGYEDGTIRPTSNITYAEVFAIMQRISNKIANDRMGNDNDMSPDAKATPIPTPSTAYAPTPTQKPMPTPTEVSSSTVYTTGSNKNNSGSSSPGPNTPNTQKPPISDGVYVFDDAISADIDALISLGNIELITINGERYNYEYFKPITIALVEEKKMVIDALREIRIQTLAQCYGSLIGYPSTLTLSIQYTDGTRNDVTVAATRIGVGDNAGKYPILWQNESDKLIKSLGQAMLKNYRLKGLKSVSGTLSKCIERDALGETWELKLHNGTTTTYRFNYKESSEIIACVPQQDMEHAEVEVFFNDDKSIVAERVFIIGPDDINPVPVQLSKKVSVACEWQIMYNSIYGTLLSKMLSELKDSSTFFNDLFDGNAPNAWIDQPFKVRKLVGNDLLAYDDSEGIKFSKKINNDDYYFITKIEKTSIPDEVDNTSYGCMIENIGDPGVWHLSVDKDSESTVDLINAHEAIHSLSSLDLEINETITEMFLSIGVSDIDDIRFVDIGHPEHIIIAYFNAEGNEYGCLLNMRAESAAQAGLENLVVYPINDLIEKLNLSSEVAR